MVGAGHSPLERRLGLPGTEKEPVEWITLDNNPDCKPDVLFDLTEIQDGILYPPKLHPEMFDEIHAYEVLEHCGQQGDFKLFFMQMRFFWNLLKPKGLLLGTTPAPTSIWAWGDPGHTRVIQPETFHFVTKAAYANLGKHQGSDYKRLVDPCYFHPVLNTIQGDYTYFILRAEK